MNNYGDPTKSNGNPFCVMIQWLRSTALEHLKLNSSHGFRWRTRLSWLTVRTRGVFDCCWLECKKGKQNANLILR